MTLWLGSAEPRRPYKRCFKRVYKTLSAARRFCANFWLREGRNQWAYKCPKCGGWHTTSKPLEEQIKRGLSVTLK
jgi:hypothetical protein